MLAAMAFALPVTIFPMASLKLGLGMHIWDLKPEWHTPYWKVGHEVCTQKYVHPRLMKCTDGLRSRSALPHGLLTHKNILVFDVSPSLPRTFDQDVLLYHEYLCDLLYRCMSLHVTLSVRIFLFPGVAPTQLTCCTDVHQLQPTGT